MRWLGAAKREREERVALERQAQLALHLEELKAIHAASDAAIKHLLADAVEARVQAKVEREAYLDALRSLRDVALAQSGAVEQVAVTIKTYFEAFKWDGAVSAHTHTDFTEWQDQMKAFAASGTTPEGFQVAMSPEERLAWVQRLTDQILPE